MFQHARRRYAVPDDDELACHCLRSVSGLFHRKGKMGVFRQARRMSQSEEEPASWKILTATQ